MITTTYTVDVKRLLQRLSDASYCASQPLIPELCKYVSWCCSFKDYITARIIIIKIKEKMHKGDWQLIDEYIFWQVHTRLSLLEGEIPHERAD